ncbi:MAG: sigma-70 family RNA polymerase sigma factor [Acidobacteriota bacterium]|nr:sigma-70 family RNA polymerase sigma factor [Acidobacteriota bacterium]
MLAVEENNVTQLLEMWSTGDRSALDRLTPILYDELRRLAASHLRRSQQSDTIQPTSLVHEAYLKLADQRKLEFRNRAQFFGLAAQVMRTIIVDHARAKAAAKRGGSGVAVTLHEEVAAAPQHEPDVLLLHEALEALAEQDRRKASIVEMRYFGGMNAQEIADALGISVATVGREIRVAQAWLLRRMRQ